MTNTTIVTGLWDIGRGEMNNDFSRNISEYVSHLNQLVNETDVNIYLYIEPKLRNLLTFTKNDRIFIVERSIEQISANLDFSDVIESIRTSPDWYNFADWLPESPQAKLKYYNVITFSKYFLLNDAVISNPFESKYFYWLDGGIARTVSTSYITNEIIDKIPHSYDVNNKLLFLSFPYTGNNEVHGFRRTGMNRFSNVPLTEYVCRGGFFGGSKELISKYNTLYYNLLGSTLKEGYMGTEESIFTIMSYIYTSEVERFNVGDSGLIYTFFEYIKNTTYNPKKESLYVLSFNSPSQFEALNKSFAEVDYNFIAKPTKYLINNSTDSDTDDEYSNLCKKYGYGQIKFNNIGINGARQYVAQHFSQSDSDYYIFFEDDMFLNNQSTQCICNFSTKLSDLYSKSLDVMKKEEFDFLKLSFCEFYGTNGTQFAWYNIPQELREEQFPGNSTLPVAGQSPNAPATKFDRIGTYNGLSYAVGQVYYCNWPIWFNKRGNHKVFLETIFEHPYEQTWMSNTFSIYLRNELKTAVLLASPINHSRFEHYDAEDRREN
jgi:hypothetical protein